MDRIRNLTRNQVLVLLALAAPVGALAHRAFGSISQDRRAQRIVDHAEAIARSGFEYLMDTGDFPESTTDGTLPPEIARRVPVWDDPPSVSFAWKHWLVPDGGAGSPERLLAGVVVRTGGNDALAEAVRSAWRGPTAGSGTEALVLLFENAP